MFDRDFEFGTGISSYQTEGAYKADLKVPSIWDEFTHEGSNIEDNSDGDVATDFYHRYREDILLAKELGISSFRLSLSWCRIINEDQSVNYQGISFYRQVLSFIRECQMKCAVTLYHWDLPLYLDTKGGFANPGIKGYYLTYVKAVVENLGDLIDVYFTFNEPQCIIGLGMNGIEQAPKRIYPISDLVKACHNILLCHALAFRLIKDTNPSSKVSFVNTFTPYLPTDRENKDEEEKAYQMTFKSPVDRYVFFTPSVFMDPLFLGHYPQEYYQEFAPLLSFVTKQDMDLIKESTPDDIYINIYTGRDIHVEKDKTVRIIEDDRKEDQTSFNWLKVKPESLYYAVKYAFRRYQKPVYISENGVPYEDTREDNRVHDEKRTEFIKRYLEQLDKARKEGIPVKGYYYWSLEDNFEWAFGYTKRFGLVYIDYQDDLRRIKKDSFYAYQRIIKEAK